MKEIGMEKLIELLNEYCKEKEFNTEWYEGKFGPKVKPYEHLTQGVVNGIIIGNHYGFIKRLVENDKIDKTELYFECEIADLNLVDKALMLLSIQDKPIEILISILK